MTNNQTDLLYAHMTAGALKSIPRMFSSFHDVLVELLQNAYRASAGNVCITHEAAQSTLEVDDDGPGLLGAQVLLDVGDSAWSEAVARAACPAGMGALAAFAFASKVVFTSRLADGTGWRLTATPEALQTPAQPALLEPLSHAAGEHGFSVKMVLSGEAVLSKHVIERARALYPFRVVLRTAEGEEVLEPYRTFRPDVTVETPYGRVEWSPSQNYLCDEPTQFSREGQWHGSRVLRSALMAAAERHPAAAVAKVVAAKPLLWFVPDGDGIQLHLPDRTELIDTVALHRAAEAIITALTAAVIEAAQAAARTWPDRLDATFLPVALSSHWLQDEAVRKVVVEHLGWHLVGYDGFRELWVAEDGDGVSISGDAQGYLERKSLPVASTALAENLARCGVAAYYAPASTRVRARVRGLRHDLKASPYLALAEGLEIEVDGKPLRTSDSGEPLDIRWLAAVDGAFDLFDLDAVSAAVVWLGDVPALARYLGSGEAEAQSLLNAVVLYDYHGYGSGCQYCEWLDDLEMDYRSVADEVLVGASQAFEPNMAGRRAIYFGLAHATAALVDSGRELDRVAHILKSVEHADARRLAARIAAADKSLARLRQEMAAAEVVHGRRAGVLAPAPRAKRTAATARAVVKA
jgi:Histidine kinase-, DNA gyrase B-, and HSP90-like ATPase